MRRGARVADPAADRRARFSKQQLAAARLAADCIDAQPVGVQLRIDHDPVEDVLEPRPQLREALVIHLGARAVAAAEVVLRSQHAVIGALRPQKRRDAVFHLQLVDPLRLIETPPRRAQRGVRAERVGSVDPRSHVRPVRRVALRIDACSRFDDQVRRNRDAVGGVGSDVIPIRAHAGVAVDRLNPVIDVKQRHANDRMAGRSRSGRAVSSPTRRP